MKKNCHQLSSKSTGVKVATIILSVASSLFAIVVHHDIILSLALDLNLKETHTHEDFKIPSTSINNREFYNSTNFLQFYVKARGQHCTLKQKFEPNDISYCAIARSGSTTLSEYFTHHNHDCSVKDLERLGARRIVIALRHPLARISSGFSRRIEGKRNGKLS